MSRVSLNRRIERLRDFFVPPTSRAWRIERLGDGERERFLRWQEECAGITSGYENTPGAAYAAMIEGNLHLPVLERSLRYTMWPEYGAIDAEADPRRAWEMLLEGRS